MPPTISPEAIIQWGKRLLLYDWTESRSWLIIAQASPSILLHRYYSMCEHVEKLAEEIKEGAASVEGVEAKIWQVPETLPDEVLKKMSAPQKSDVPIITPSELPEADGFVFGFPIRFGMMAAQFKAFLDAIGGLWRTHHLAGNLLGSSIALGLKAVPGTLPDEVLKKMSAPQKSDVPIITPSELPEADGFVFGFPIRLTAITQLVHHGMIFVRIGYIFGADMFGMEKVKGGSPNGVGTFAGDGSGQLSKLEVEKAFHRGKYIAIITKKMNGAA
ncbi:unnamed protein product [Fraxinus pennsylvanica]|uniref:NAD(P)H dehydrogenase (quinone) n=1 Tax=Fraxinus pennsylvanica TaxID=56036 RepID=A0AAD1Z1A1_9LAMI|nr:unnamed protein product [Fraxinus pennsylvanica]